MVAKMRRAAQAKYLLSQGVPVKEVVNTCGVSFYWATLISRNMGQ